VDVFQFLRAVESDDLPNALLVATLSGFVQNDQRELLRAFLPRYFAAIPDVWRLRALARASPSTA